MSDRASFFFPSGIVPALVDSEREDHARLMADYGGKDIIISLVSLFVGALIAAVATKLQNRTAKLTYSTRIERVAWAVDDPVFGAVRVSWRNTNVRNLHMSIIEIENSSGRDFENVGLKVYTTNDTVLLNEFTSVVGTPYIVEWSREFRAQLVVPPDADATDEQLRIYNHSREYLVPVFNRGQVLRFNHLCTRPGDDTRPFVFVSTVLKGGKLVQQLRANLVFGVPVHLAAARGSVVSVLAVIACGLFVRNVWIASTICMSVGLWAQMIGALQYRTERRVRRLLFG
jgi:hypothetical protein